jgi:RNA polymerase sigma factor (sigma-70 family)
MTLLPQQNLKKIQGVSPMPAVTSAAHHDVLLVELDDADLLNLVRQDDDEKSDAYGVLYDRYVHAARRLARHLGQREDADDVVSESFAQVLDLLRRKKGPDRAFRAYLFSTIRHECGRRAKAAKRVMPTDDNDQIDTPVAFGAGGLDDFERSAIRAAFESLPERWRQVLWLLDVEGHKPNELAPLLDLKPNSVSALVYRARSGLRDAYLQQHVKNTETPDSRSCRSVRSMLASVVRRSASMRDQEKVHAHLETCTECMAIYLDLQEVNQDVGMIVAPAALAAAVGGGGLALGAHAGAAIFANLLANLVTGVKSLLVTASVPAAVAVSGAAVISVNDQPHDVPQLSAVRTALETPTPKDAHGPATSPTVVAKQRPARVSSNPRPEVKQTEQSAAVVSGARVQAGASGTGVLPAQGKPPVAVHSGGVEVNVGPVNVSVTPTTTPVKVTVPPVDKLLGGIAAVNRAD